MEVWLLLTLKTNFFYNKGETGVKQGDEDETVLLARYDHRQRIRCADVDDEEATKKINRDTLFKSKFKRKLTGKL